MLRSALTTTYDNDDLGRRTGESSAAGDVTYTWNALGQLARVASTEATATYEYGPSGMRERAVVESQEGTSTTTSAWVGSRLALERDSDGTTYRYLYGPDGIPLELVVTTQGGTPVSFAYQCDRAGSVIALTDSSGTVVASYSYDPWGDVLSTGGSDPALAERNPLRYRAYYFDTATGHYYLPARYYDPATARFLSADPAAPKAGDPFTLNSYMYCVGDPVNLRDPSGAIMDSDGNGKLDNYDHNLANAKAVRGTTREDYYNAQAGVQYYGSQLEAAVESGACADAVEVVTFVVLLVDAFVRQTIAWAEMNGYTDYYIDANVLGISSRGLGMGGGLIRNHTRGSLMNEHPYFSICGGPPGQEGVSLMAGTGHIASGTRYLEFGVGTPRGFGAAYGWRVDNDATMPWEFGAMGDHRRNNDYFQGGMSSPGGAAQWVFVL